MAESPLLNPNDLRAVREVKVEVKIGDVAIPVNGVSLTHMIDQLPYLELSAQLDNTTKGGVQVGGVEINLAKFNKLNWTAQTHVLDDFSVLPDLQVIVTDGEGRQIDFVGFLGRPSIKLQHGRLHLGFTGVHAKSVLQCFNSRIYLGVERYSIFNSQSIRDAKTLRSAMEELSRQSLARESRIMGKSQSTRFNNVADWISAILADLRNGYQTANAVPSADREPLWDNIHALNNLVLPDVVEVLELSKDGTFIDGLEEISNAVNGENLYRNLYDLLVGQPNLLGVLDQARDMFLLQLNATWGGALWLEHRTMFEPFQARIQAPPAAVYYDLAHTFEAPLLQAVVETGGSEFYGLSRGGGEQFSPSSISLQEPGNQAQPDTGVPKLSSRARYPEPLPARGPSGELVAGTYLIVEAPNWVAHDVFSMQTINELKQPTGKELKDVVNFYLERRKDVAAQRGLRMKILDYLAEFFYKSAFLGKTQAVVTIPLLVGTGKQAMQVGRVYRIESAVTKEPMFDGYLRQVTHDVSVEPEGGNATTTLQFSHIRVPGD